MKTITTVSATMLLGLYLALSGGCSPSDSQPAAGKGTPKQPAKDEHAHAHDDHDHPSKGPHNGDLIELGKEEYHAELLHDDDAGTVIIYLLDSGAKKPVAIEAESVTINLKQDGKGEQFPLSAAAQDGDKAGTASRFVSKNKELSADLEHHGAQPRLVVEIAGKSYSGEIKHEHHHDHDGHEHQK